MYPKLFAIVLTAGLGALTSGARAQVPEATPVDISRTLIGEIDFTHLASPITFSPDGGRVAWTIKEFKPGGWFAKWAITVFVDGEAVGRKWSRTGVEHFGMELSGIAPDASALGGAAVLFSDDGTRHLYVGQEATAKKVKGEAVVVDGVEGPLFGVILTGPLRFSPDALRYGYMARAGKTVTVVVDGKEVATWEEGGFSIGNAGLAFSPEGGHVAWIGRNGKQRFVVTDRVAGPLVDRITHWGSYAGRIYYWGETKAGGALYLDGQAGKTYPTKRWLPTVEITEDGGRVAYSVKTKAGYCVVVDGKESAWYQQFGRLLFTPGSNHLVFTARKSGKEIPSIYGKNRSAVAVVDGVEGPAYGSVAFLKVSADGEHIAYRADLGRVVLDGVAGPKFDNVGGLEFAPDGRLAYVAQEGEERFVVLDGEVLPGRYAIIRRLVFGPRSDRLAVVALSEGKWYLVVDGTPGPGFDEIYEATVAFDEATDSYLYVARSGDRHHLVVDGEVVGDHSVVLRPRFNESSGVSYFAFEGAIRMSIMPESGTFIATPTFAPFESFFSGLPDKGEIGVGLTGYTIGQRRSPGLTSKDERLPLYSIEYPSSRLGGSG